MRTGRLACCWSLVLGLTCAPLPGQTRDDGGLWLMWLGQGRFAAADEPLAALRWWLDVQPRWLGDGDRYDTTLLRPGLGWTFSERVTAHVGYAWIETDPVGHEAFVEQRAWQQVLWSPPTDGFSLLSRTRLEQRFVEGRGETGWRLRQFVKATLPLSHDGDVFGCAYDEVFYDLNDTDWGAREGLRQNRAFVGLGYRFDRERRWSVEVGYLNQWIDRPAVDAMNHILSLNLFMNF